MKQFTYIETLGPEKGIATISLNRPEVHNAFNIEMIRELLLAYAAFNSDDKARIILLKASGENFSSGADLKWMKEGINQSEEELKRESRELAHMFKAIYESGKVTIVLALGKVIGGANGLLAASDIVVASPESSFSFSEAKVGLIPATIAPYVIQKTGISIAREWFLTSRAIRGVEAYDRGLVNYLVDKLEVDRKSKELCDMLLQNGPEALISIKDMLRIKNIGERPNSLVDETVEMLTSKRISTEAKEGITAFLEKRKPKWTDEI